MYVLCGYLPLQLYLNTSSNLLTSSQLGQGHPFKATKVPARLGVSSHLTKEKEIPAWLRTRNYVQLKLFLFELN